VSMLPFPRRITRPFESRPRRSPFRAAVARVITALALPVLILAPLGCGSSGEEPGPIQVIQNPGLARQWATNLKLQRGDKMRSIFVRDNYIIAYTDQGWVYGLTRDTGEPRLNLKVPSGDFRMFPPLVLKEHLVIPTITTLEIYSLTGSKERSLEVGAAIRADCVGAGHNVFVPVDSPDGGARLKRYDLTNRAASIPAWELQAWRGGLASAPALHTDTVYFAAETGTVYAVTANDREPIWPLPGNVFDARSPVTAPLAADDVGLYVSTVEGKLYCVNRTTGQVKWQWFASGPLEEAPVPLADTIYVPDPNRGWAAVDKVENPEIKVPQYNRKERWIRDDIVQILSQDDRYTYTLTKDGHISALDKKNGQTKFRSERSDFNVLTTNSKDSTIYSATERGRVFAIRPVLQPGQTGEVVQVSPPAGDDATLVVPLYAVEQ